MQYVTQCNSYLSQQRMQARREIEEKVAFLTEKCDRLSEEIEKKDKLGDKIEWYEEECRKDEEEKQQLQKDKKVKK